MGLINYLETIRKQTCIGLSDRNTTESQQSQDALFSIYRAPTGRTLSPEPVRGEARLLHIRRVAGCLVERGGGQEEGEGGGEVEERGKRQTPPPARARHQLQYSSTEKVFFPYSNSGSKPTRLGLLENWGKLSEQGTEADNICYLCPAL